MTSRQKVHVTCTLSRVAMSMIEELMTLTGWDRSRCIEECVRAYAPELIKRFRKMGGSSEDNKSVDLSERYMRRMIFGDLEKTD